MRDRRQVKSEFWGVAILIIAGLLVALCGVASAQITWERRYGGDYNERATAVIQPSADLAYIVVGATNSYGPGSPNSDNPFIMKVDYRGQLLWFRTHGSAVTDRVLDVKEALQDRGYFMCGHRYSEFGLETMLLMRVDPLGNLLWERTYGGDLSGVATSVTPTLDGGCLLTGYLTDAFPAYAEVILLKIGEDGNVLWKRNFVWPFGGVGYRALETVDGGFVFAGWANFGGELQEQYFVVWTDSMGLPYRTRYYGGVGPDRLISIVRTPSGYILVGNTADDPPFHAWPRLVGISRYGEVQWDRILVESFSQPVYGCATTRDGALILTGGMQDLYGASDLYLMKTNGQGEMIWRRRYGAGGGYADVGYGVTQTRDGGYLTVGLSSSGGPGDSIYIIKTGPDGTLESAVAPDAALAMSKPTLLISPNPFRSVTSVPGHGKEPVVLYDVGGRIVGRYEASRIGGDLSPGVYFLKLQGLESDPLRIVKTP